MDYPRAQFCDTLAPEELSTLPELQAKLLANRGIMTKEDANIFLHPEYEKLHDPFLMHDMEKAVVRIYEAMSANEKIIIYSDYDCDGIPGGTILHDLFTKIGYVNFENYIPHRHDEGYGLNPEAIDEFIKREVKLVITVDLGTTDVADIATAQANGIDVIVTDHHEPPPELPHAFAIVNPKLGSYPDPMLCGAGVAFKLSCAFIQKYGELYSIPTGWEKWLLDMAALGTLADMVPLKNENRIIASFGLTVLKKNRRPGLRALLTKMNIDPANLSEDDIGFMIAPRINAASRMGIPYRAFELLSTTDPIKAQSLALHLTQLNDDRKTQVATIMREIGKTLAKRDLSAQAGEEPIIVIGNPGWGAGVLGLIASKIMDSHSKPVFVWGGESNGEMKGSVRGNGTINIVELMRRAPEGTFIGFGGHEHAGGFSITTEQVVILNEKLQATYQRMEISETSASRDGITIDAVLPLEQISGKLIKDICQLAPFGLGNPKPTFLIPQVIIQSARHFGKERNHLEVVVGNGEGREIKGIKFFAGKDSFSTPLTEGAKVDIIGTLEESSYRGYKELRLRLVDIG